MFFRKIRRRIDESLARASIHCDKRIHANFDVPALLSLMLRNGLRQFENHIGARGHHFGLKR